MEEGPPPHQDLRSSGRRRLREDSASPSSSPSRATVGKRTKVDCSSRTEKCPDHQQNHRKNYDLILETIQRAGLAPLEASSLAQKIETIINPEEPTQQPPRSRPKKATYPPKFRPITYSSSPHQHKPLHYEFCFEGDAKRSVNPFKLEETVTDKSGFPPKRLFGINKSKVVVELDPRATGDITTLKEVDSTPCTVSLYAPFNTSRGLIYLRHFDASDKDSLPQFQSWLKTKYDVASVTHAPFIKPRNPSTVPLIVTLNGNQLPFSLYIPGEESDTKVYPFRNKPMLCKKCTKYGHTAARCRSQVTTCMRCAATGHSAENCDPNIAPKCSHCQGDHMAGSRDCSRFQREQLLLQIQEDRKVSLRRAVQIDQDINPTPSSNHSYPDVIDLTLKPEDKKTFTPWLLEKCITTVCGPVSSIRSANASTFCVEVSSPKQSIALLALTHLHNKPVEAARSKRFICPKGLGYIYDYNLLQFDHFKSQLLARLPLSNIEVAPWIKSKNPSAIAVLFSFSQPEVPSFLDIPGEQALTKIYEFTNKPMFCKTCLEFGHTPKHCQQPPRCNRCTTSEIPHNNCVAPKPVCLYCAEDHFTGSRVCPQTKYEAEILALQTKERISRKQARLIVDQRNPHLKSLNFSAAVVGSQKSISHLPIDHPQATDKSKSTAPSTKPPREPPSPSAISVENDYIATKKMFEALHCPMAENSDHATYQEELQASRKASPLTRKHRTQQKESPHQPRKANRPPADRHQTSRSLSRGGPTPPPSQTRKQENRSKHKKHHH